MSTPEPVSLSSITAEIDVVIGKLTDLGVLPSERDQERARLIEILQHVSGIVRAAADCEQNGASSFVPGWSRE